MFRGRKESKTAFDELVANHKASKKLPIFQDCLQQLEKNSLLSVETLLPTLIHHEKRKQLDNSDNRQAFLSLYHHCIDKTANLLQSHARQLFINIPLHQFLKLRDGDITSLDNAPTDKIFHTKELDDFTAYYNSLVEFVHFSILKQSNELSKILMFDYWLAVVKFQLSSLDLYSLSAINAALSSINIEKVFKIALHDKAFLSLDESYKNKFTTYFDDQIRYSILSPASFTFFAKLQELAKNHNKGGIFRTLATSTCVPALPPYRSALFAFASLDPEKPIEAIRDCTDIVRVLATLQQANAKLPKQLIPENALKVPYPLETLSQRTIDFYQELPDFHKATAFLQEEWQLIRDPKLQAIRNYSEELFAAYHHAFTFVPDEAEERKILSSILYQLSFQLGFQPKMDLLKKAIEDKYNFKNGDQKVKISKTILSQLKKIKDAIVAIEPFSLKTEEILPFQLIYENDLRPIYCAQVLKFFLMFSRKYPDFAYPNNLEDLVEKAELKDLARLRIKLMSLEDENNPEKRAKAIEKILQETLPQMCKPKVKALKLNLSADKQNEKPLPSPSKSRLVKRSPSQYAMKNMDASSDGDSSSSYTSSSSLLVRALNTPSPKGSPHQSSSAENSPKREPSPKVSIAALPNTKRRSLMMGAEPARLTSSDKFKYGEILSGSRDTLAPPRDPKI